MRPPGSSASPSNAPSAGRANAANKPRADGQKVFGIVQGGSNAALREECAKALVAMDFDGYAIGGVSVGEPEPEMLKAIEITVPLLPADKARYAMGLGTPAQMLELDRARRGHVRLRAADARRPQRHGLHARGRDRHQGRRSTRPTSGRLRRAATVSPAGISRAPICGIC